MAEQVEYAVVIGADIEELGAKVAEMLNKDWEPCGGLCLIPEGLGQAVSKGLGQAVFKDPVRVKEKRVRKTSLDVAVTASVI